MTVRSMETRASAAELRGARRATVVEVQRGGQITVRLDGRSGVTACDFLETTAGAPPLLRPGDAVLVLVPEGDGGRPAVIGRVGPYRPPDRRELLLEANEEVTIRCGDAAITLRDGKILIKGVDVVSHARRRNRIRGGSVEVN